MNTVDLTSYIQGAQPDLTIAIQSTGSNDQSPSIVLSTMSQTIVDGKFSSLLINFSDLPGSGAQLVRIPLCVLLLRLRIL